MKLTINKKSIIARVRDILLVIVFFSVFVSFFPAFDDKWIAFSFLLAIAVLPSIILLIEYLVATTKIEWVELFDDRLEINYKTGQLISRHYEDIKVVELYKAAGMDKGNYSFNSNEKYWFARIIPKNGETIILTSLLGPELSSALDMMTNVPVDRTRTGFAFIYLM